MFLKKDEKDEARALLEALIAQGKLATTASIYRRIKPGPDGCIRTVLNPGGTETGRLSSSDTFLEPSTNLQNLNKKVAKEGALFNVRQCLIPRPTTALCEADYSAAERRLLAYIAEEPEAIRQIEQGINTYKWFAGKLFGINDYDSISKDTAEYFIGKMAVLALDRGVRPKTLQAQVNASSHLTGAILSSADSSKAYALFHQVFPGYAMYYQRLEQSLRRHNYVTTNICGRTRQFFARRNTASGVESIVREAVSFQAQAVGDIINQALVRIYSQYDPDLLRILLQVHDAIIWECDEEQVVDTGRLVKQEMERPIQVGSRDIIIPVELSYSTTSWADMVDLDV
jgi:DNA polymerase-1